MEVSSETRRKVRDFVFAEFGKDRVRSVDVRMGLNSFGDESFILSLIVEPGESFEGKESELFHLFRNVRNIGGADFRGLAPVLDLHAAKD